MSATICAWRKSHHDDFLLLNTWKWFSPRHEASHLVCVIYSCMSSSQVFRKLIRCTENIGKPIFCKLFIQNVGLEEKNLTEFWIAQHVWLIWLGQDVRYIPVLSIFIGLCWSTLRQWWITVKVSLASHVAGRVLFLTLMANLFHQEVGAASTQHCKLQSKLGSQEPSFAGKKIQYLSKFKTT